MYFPEKDKIFSELGKIILEPTKIIVGVSGGPDSRFLFALLEDFYTTKGWDPLLLIVAHYNHGQRAESNEEEQMIYRWYENFHIYYNTDKPSKGKNETTLRIYREDFFEEVLQKENASYIATGHHLDDRIETSFMNLVRGSSLKGLINMSFYNYKQGIFHLRPLIELQKRYIQELCDMEHIVYCTDPTNKNSSLTLRNALRNTVFPQLDIRSSQSKWYDSWLLIYKQLERVIDKSSDDIMLQEIKSFGKPSVRSIHKIKKLGIDEKVYTENDRIYIFHKLNIRKQVSQKTLAEWVRFSNTNTDGYKFLAGVYFFMSHAHIYAIRAADEFWLKKNDMSQNISGKQHSILFDEIPYMVKSERTGATIRYAKEGDIYKGKRVKKWMLNKKIPVFVRNIVPVIEKNNHIIDVVTTHIEHYFI